MEMGTLTKPGQVLIFITVYLLIIILSHKLCQNIVVIYFATETMCVSFVKVFFFLFSQFDGSAKSIEKLILWPHRFFFLQNIWKMIICINHACSIGFKMTNHPLLLSKTFEPAVCQQ